MSLAPQLRSLRSQLLHGWRKRAVSLKAVSFAMIGVVNTLVDYGVFLLASGAFAHSSTAPSLFASVSAFCRCGGSTSIALIAANMTSWLVAATGSYMLNSSITFAAESGRKLRCRSYLLFVISGIAGWLVNTAVLVFTAQILLLPIYVAKAVAILGSFFVNFSLSHFFVFRVRHQPAPKAREDT